MAANAFKGPETDDAQSGTAKNLEIKKETPYNSFNYLKENPTLANCRQYAKNLKEFVAGLGTEANSNKDLETFISDVKKYLRPIMMADFALQSWQEGTQDASYLQKKYGPYTKERNDCFSYMAKIRQQYSDSLTVKKIHGKLRYYGDGKPKYAYDMENSLPITTDGDAKDEKAIKLGFGGTLHLQAGDMIEAKQSPFGTGSNHWGMIVEEDGKLLIVHRGTNKIFKEPIEDFLKNNNHGDISVIRYGKPGISQHFEVDVNKDFNGKRSYSWKLINSPVPDKLYYTSKEKESELKKAQTIVDSDIRIKAEERAVSNDFWT
jgi:hypothetical protein